MHITKCDWRWVFLEAYSLEPSQQEVTWFDSNPFFLFLPNSFEKRRISFKFPKALEDACSERTFVLHSYFMNWIRYCQCHPNTSRNYTEACSCSQSCKNRLLTSSCPSVFSQDKTRLPVDGLSSNFVLLTLLSKSVDRIQAWFKSDKTAGNLHEDIGILVVISRLILPGWKKLEKNCRENQNTQFISNTIFPKILPFAKQLRKARHSRTRHTRILC